MTAQIRPSGQHFSFDVALSCEYGIEEALLIHHFQHWIRVNKTRGNNFKDGRTWTYQTIQEIADHFPFLNYEKVKYAVEQLTEKGVIIKGNYNKSAIDKTTWYAFVDESIFVPDLEIKSKNVYERENSPSKEKIPHRKRKFPHIPDTKPTDAKTAYQEEISLESEEKKKSYDLLQEFDVLSDEKSKVVDKYSNQQIIEALAVTDEKCSTENKKARWKYFISVLKSPPRKNATPYEELSQIFENQHVYNGATCYLSKDAIAFERGMKHLEIKFGFFNWKNFEEICSEFAIKFNRKKEQ